METKRKKGRRVLIVADDIVYAALYFHTLPYMNFLREHWVKIRTNNPLERIMKEIRRRIRVVGSFPDGNSALMLAAARLKHIAGTKWGKIKYMNMNREEVDVEEN